LLTAQIEVSKDLERLIDARFRLGQAPANELYQQREQTTLLTQLKLVNDTKHGALEKSLDILLGDVPDTVPRVILCELPDPPELIALGTSEDLIRNRADIRAGYARLRQAAARVGISFAERLPTLQVTASLTTLADQKLSSEWSSLVLDLAVPIFTGGRLRATGKQAQFVLEEERQRYVELWLTALEEVTTLTWKHQQQQKVIKTLASRRGHAQKALDSARHRFVLGDQNYLNVLTALKGLQDADRSMITQRRQLISLWIQASESIGQSMCTLSSECKQNWRL
jgi:outer membrane protein TolC